MPHILVIKKNWKVKLNWLQINNIYGDIEEIDLSQKYDRITSIATFEHITDLPKVVAKEYLETLANRSVWSRKLSGSETVRRIYFQFSVF